VRSIANSSYHLGPQCSGILSSPRCLGGMTSIVLKGYVSALTNQNQEGLHLALALEYSKRSGAGGTRMETYVRNV
jgi:hypothetical protein